MGNFLKFNFTLTLLEDAFSNWISKHLNSNKKDSHNGNLFVAGEPGFEPRYYPPEGYVLPLDDSPIFSSGRYCSIAVKLGQGLICARRGGYYLPYQA